jgi:tetratricopeptide (TPR) repeat protein
MPQDPQNQSTPAPAKEDLIQLFDESGRKVYVNKETWRKDMLPGIVKKSWDNPDQLYQIILGSLNDGFFDEILDASRHLSIIDTIPARGTCIYAINLMKLSQLEEAENVLRSYIAIHGEEGTVLTNLAKIQAKRNQRELSEQTLWHALEVDPNQQNGLGWLMAIYQERSGSKASHDALLRIARSPSSWLAQLWLARAALEQKELPEAFRLYDQALSRAPKPVPADMLMQMSGDLGRAGQLRELLTLTEPHFVAQIHGLSVGNNLIKAHLDLGELEAAQTILDQLRTLSRPDFKGTLDFWEAEIAKIRDATRQ